MQMCQFFNCIIIRSLRGKGNLFEGSWELVLPRAAGPGTLCEGVVGVVPRNVSLHPHSLVFSELFPKPKLESSATHLDQGDILNLWCSIPGAPGVDFAIQKGGINVSQAQNFTKIASKWDSGSYTCLASMGKVIKRSNEVLITVCGEYTLAGSEF